MVVCEYTRCLPHCTSFNYQEENGKAIVPDDEIPNTCKVWSNGCNTCYLSEYKETLVGDNGKEYVYTTYKLDGHSACSKTFCEEWGKPRCVEWKDCMVDADIV